VRLCRAPYESRPSYGHPTARDFMGVSEKERQICSKNEHAAGDDDSSGKDSVKGTKKNPHSNSQTGREKGLNTFVGCFHERLFYFDRGKAARCLGEERPG